MAWSHRFGRRALPIPQGLEWRGRHSGTYLLLSSWGLLHRSFRFSDPDGLLELSSEQKEAGVLWRRPREAFANAKIFSPDLRPEDIVQRIVADCSLCASIIVCLLHSQTNDSEVRSPASWCQQDSDSITRRRRCPSSTPEGRTEGCTTLRQADMNSKCSLTVPIDEYAPPYQ
jgi:hypothetical protein